MMDKENRTAADRAVIPLKVRDHRLFYAARGCFGLFLHSLPESFDRDSWADCLYRLESEKVPDFEYCFSISMQVLAASLGLGPDEGGVLPMRTVLREGRLMGVAVRTAEGVTFLDRDRLNALREEISEANGWSIPDETWNPELVAALEYRRRIRRNEAGVVPDFDTLVWSVAANSGRTYEELQDMSMKGFLSLRDAIGRKLNYPVFALARLLGGARFSDGGPFPCWEFAAPDRPFDTVDDRGTLPHIEEMR